MKGGLTFPKSMEMGGRKGEVRGVKKVEKGVKAK